MNFRETVTHLIAEGARAVTPPWPHLFGVNLGSFAEVNVRLLAVLLSAVAAVGQQLGMFPDELYGILRSTWRGADPRALSLLYVNGLVQSKLPGAYNGQIAVALAQRDVARHERDQARALVRKYAAGARYTWAPEEQQQVTEICAMAPGAPTSPANHEPSIVLRELEAAKENLATYRRSGQMAYGALIDAQNQIERVLDLVRPHFQTSGAK